MLSCPSVVSPPPHPPPIRYIVLSGVMTDMRSPQSIRLRCCTLPTGKSVNVHHCTGHEPMCCSTTLLLQQAVSGHELWVDDPMQTTLVLTSRRKPFTASVILLF
jgi:hypothetical protein